MFARPRPTVLVGASRQRSPVLVGASRQRSPVPRLCLAATWLAARGSNPDRLL